MEGLESFASKSGSEFASAVMSAQAILSLAHSDVDGLAAAVIFARALPRTGRKVSTIITGKGENPWSPALQQRLAHEGADLLIVSDLGSRELRVFDLPTVIVDHHRPLGSPDNAVLLSGYGVEPTPTSGLIAYFCASALTDCTDLAWIAGMSVLADMADESLLDTLPITRKQMKSAAVREAISLLNAARRSATGDASIAYSLLLKSESPDEIVSQRHPETAKLRAMREQVQTELARARKIGPKFPPKSADAAKVAIIKMDSACQIHPLIAQQWRTRLKDYIVMAANTGFRPGFVHFSARAAADDLNLLDFLKRYAPTDTDEGFGNGHNRASGGALTHPAWNEFIHKLGFGADMEVHS